ncbi:hypothetical protein ACIQPR_43580 [Streptomyces sp. NPDC091280]|uniref:hypothetical protein n=1 Tax=Streptomyces sp. NPDC091280 TaxID=3365984 RepID=UPI003829EB8E
MTYRNLAVGLTSEKAGKAIGLEWNPGQHGMRVFLLDSLSGDVVECHEAEVRTVWTLDESPSHRDFDDAVMAVLDEQASRSPLASAVWEAADHNVIRWWAAAEVSSSTRAKAGDAR